MFISLWTFFSSIGNSVHEVLQTHFYLNKKSKVHTFGNWKCLHCNIITERLCVTPKNLRCSKCNTDKVLKYSEIEVNYQGVTGHVDLVLLIKDKYYVLDFKTTSTASIQNGGKHLPKTKHPMQIESYVVALKQQFDIDY